MKPIYQCEWCNFQGTENRVRQHEENCQHSPMAKELRRIREQCPYVKIEYEDFYDFYYCTKQERNRWGRYEDCKCTLECKKYLPKEFGMA